MFEGVSPELVLQYSIVGIANSLVYILMGLGVTFVSSIMRIINWAMGAFFMLGSYCQFFLVNHVLGPDLWYVAVVISVAVVFLIGALIQPVFLKQMHSKEVTRKEEYGTLVTIALGVVITGVAAIANGPDVRYIKTDFSVVHIGPVPMMGAQFVASVSLIVILAALYWFINYTWYGLALRAASQSRIGVQSAGLRIERVDQLAFGFGCALAAVAGALLAAVYLVYPQNGSVPTTKGFEIVILGGLGSIPGVVVAGALIGQIEALGSALISAAYQNVYGALLVLLIIIFRPTGLFGHKARIA